LPPLCCGRPHSGLSLSISALASAVAFSMACSRLRVLWLNRRENEAVSTFVRIFLDYALHFPTLKHSVTISGAQHSRRECGRTGGRTPAVARRGRRRNARRPFSRLSRRPTACSSDVGEPAYGKGHRPHQPNSNWAYVRSAPIAAREQTSPEVRVGP
jgi:hypothetical protein